MLSGSKLQVKVRELCLSNYGCIVPCTDTWYQCSVPDPHADPYQNVTDPEHCLVLQYVLPGKIFVNSTCLLSCFVWFVPAAFGQANQLPSSCRQVLNPSALLRHWFGLARFRLF
jgi:hypothetical protein